MKKIIELGKIDYDNVGRKVNLVQLNVELKSTEKGYVFRMSGGVWNTKKTDFITCGQMCDEITSYFPNNKRVNRLVEIWKEYHLNDMQAGTEKQMEALKGFKGQNYTDRCNYLESKGLLIDNNYKYGALWLFKQIPGSIITEIKELMID